MPIIKIEGKDYDTDTLSKEVKDQIGSMQFVDAEIRRHQAQIAVLQTARVAYGKALQQALAAPTPAPVMPAGDTLKLS